MQESTLLAVALAILPIVCRLAAFVFTMPLVAQRIVPIQIRFGAVAVLTALIAPTLVDPSSVASGAGMAATDWTTFGISLANEALIGALMGLSFTVVLAGAKLVGGLLEGLCGFSASSFSGAAGKESGGPLSQLFWWTTLAVFVAVGGLGQLVSGILESFQTIPPGQAWLDTQFVDLLVTALSQSFYFALAAALPAIAAMLVASLVLGMTQKSFPQLGGMQVGLSIKAIVAMIVTSALLLTAPWMINGGLELAFDHFLDLLANSGEVRSV